MKRMESKIVLTFAIMFVVGFIVNGLYSVISLGESFFSFGIMAKGMLTALMYLMYVWVYTRRHRTLAVMGVVSIALMVMFAGFSSEGVANTFSGWVWKDTVMTVVYVVAAFIADHQADKLLEESKEHVNIKLTLKGDIKPEDVEVSLD